MTARARVLVPLEFQVFQEILFNPQTSAETAAMTTNQMDHRKLKDTP